MTTLADKVKEWWPSICGPGLALTEGLTATQIYNGTTRPDFWIAVLAHVDAMAAANLIVSVLQDAGALHAAGELKTRIVGLSVSDDAATLEGHRVWTKGRMKAGTDDGDLERAFYQTIRFLQGSDPKAIQVPFEFVVEYRMQAESLTRSAARTNAYAFMRGQVTEVTFKGAFT